MKRYSIGMIGYGGFGRFLHGAWSEMDHVDVTAVADADPDRNPKNVRFYSDWQRLISDSQVDIVAIATPPSTHAAMAVAALKEGKHVLVEKPIATTMEDANQILAERDRAHRHITVDFMLRFNPIVEALHRWCSDGRFGVLRRVVVENYAQDESLSPEHWFWDPALSGGILVEHAVHFFDVVRWCSGSRAVRVNGIGLHRNRRQEDRMMATVLHEDGLVATHYHSFSRPNFFEQTSMRFVFDLLDIDLEGWIPMSGRLRAIVNEENESELTRLPGFQTTVRQTESNKASMAGSSRAAAARQTISVAGRPYKMEAVSEGAFALPRTKSEEYARSLRALMSDFVGAIDDPAQRLRVTAEDGVASLEIALAATADAHRPSDSNLLHA
jgi:predicted dehydrogenase